jgi:hypothetical protein
MCILLNKIIIIFNFFSSLNKQLDLIHQTASYYLIFKRKKNILHLSSYLNYQPYRMNDSENLSK